MDNSFWTKYSKAFLIGSAVSLISFFCGALISAKTFNASWVVYGVIGQWVGSVGTIAAFGATYYSLQKALQDSKPRLSFVTELAKNELRLTVINRGSVPVFLKNLLQLNNEAVILKGNVEIPSSLPSQERFTILIEGAYLYTMINNDKSAVLEFEDLELQKYLVSVTKFINEWENR